MMTNKYHISQAKIVGAKKIKKGKRRRIKEGIRGNV